MKQKKTTLNFKDKEEALNQIKKWSRERKSLEICGFLGFKDGQYVSLLCDNISEQPSRYFAIDPVEYLNFKDQNEIICVLRLANWILLIYSDRVNHKFIHGPAKGPIFLKNSTKNSQDKGVKINSIFFGIK